jgi:hypothetical protein
MYTCDRASGEDWTHPTLSKLANQSMTIHQIRSRIVQRADGDGVARLLLI